MLKLFFLNLFTKLDAYIAKEKAQAESLDLMISDLAAQKADKLHNIDRAARIQQKFR